MAADIAVPMALLPAEVIAASPLCSQNAFMIRQVKIMQALDLYYLLFICFAYNFHVAVS